VCGRILYLLGIGELPEDEEAMSNPHTACNICLGARTIPSV